ncbi:MAG: 4-hydroxy-tetrahydrodipicolinate reductase [Campylobacteraceae bacterium]|jgi:4-hydroxy-tetrahydrodipicolinate reductase|nr:4-hydroxy-tetrahydrodipicolinate reductase [Campylobacteraceae bacterium]
MVKVGIYGATGRVGKLLCRVVEESDGMELSSVYFKGENCGYDAKLLSKDAADFLAKCDVAIDFTSPEGTEELLEAAENNPTPLVIGTTGLNAHQQNLLKDAAKSMPILYATNMSLGVALLNSLVKIASEKLREFDIEIVEMHHRHKKDAPSGTALTLAEYAAAGRGLDLDSVRVSGRDGNIGARTKDEIAVMALRGGDIVGEHTVGFYNDGEFLRLSHTATSRDTFAKGAVKAAMWLAAQQKSGLYKIQDCLGI